ncbi:MAG: hypothetical protein M1820_002283 [Bogoriella megaspora]|nr:MAG: hypothetical protein M1820_002283 [Bogoriella megaspora]
MISVASHDISNTGSLKEPYPRTKGLPRALIDIIGAPLSTASQAWGYTFTDASSDVVICQSVTYNDIGGTTSVPTCAGTSATESFAPHSTVQIGIHSQNVGTLIGEALYTSVSSALNSLCPSPSPEGTLTGCSNSSVAIPDVPYSDGGTKSGGGDLNITVQSSMYHNSTIREMMIIAAALVANTTAQNQNCWNGTMQEGYDGNANGWASPREIRAVFCNAADFAGVQFLEGGHISNYLDVQWIYDAWTGNNFDCDDMTSMVETVLEATVPEAALGEIPVGLGFEVFCNEAFNHTLG